MPAPERHVMNTQAAPGSFTSGLVSALLSLLEDSMATEGYAVMGLASCAIMILVCFRPQHAPDDSDSTNQMQNPRSCDSLLTGCKAWREG